MLSILNDFNQFSFDQSILLDYLSHLEHLISDKHQEICLILVSLEVKLINNAIALLSIMTLQIKKLTITMVVIGPSIASLSESDSRTFESYLPHT